MNRYILVFILCFFTALSIGQIKPQNDLIRLSIFDTTPAWPTIVKPDSLLQMEIGLRYEFSWMFTKESNNSLTNADVENSLSVAPLGLFLNIGLRFPSSFKIDLRYGAIIGDEEFGGSQIGLYILSELLNLPLYLEGGISYYSYSGSGHGTINFPSNSFALYSLGFGYHASKHIYLDLNWYIPTDKNIGEKIIVASDNSIRRIDISNNGILKIGVQYIFRI